MTVIVAAIRIAHNAALTLLVASAGFVVASVIAFNTEFRPWADGLAITYFWNFALAIALYALMAVLLIGKGVARLVASMRRP
jgi:hypothetical protein